MEDNENQIANDEEDRMRMLRLNNASKVISDFLIASGGDYQKGSYEDEMNRCCNTFEQEVDEHKLIIFCNEDGYIGFIIEDMEVKNEINKM